MEDNDKAIPARLLILFSTSLVLVIIVVITFPYSSRHWHNKNRWKAKKKKKNSTIFQRQILHPIHGIFGKTFFLKKKQLPRLVRVQQFPTLILPHTIILFCFILKPPASILNFFHWNWFIEKKKKFPICGGEKTSAWTHNFPIWLYSIQQVFFVLTLQVRPLFALLHILELVDAPLSVALADFA